MKDRLEQLKAVSPAAPGSWRVGGRSCEGEGLPFAPHIEARGGPRARPELPELQQHPRPFRTPPPLRGHVPVVHPWAAISVDACVSPPPAPPPKPASVTPELGSAGGGCLSPAGVLCEVRGHFHLPAAAWHYAQDQPPPTLLVSL